MRESLFRFPFKRCHNFKKQKFCRINRGAESDKRQMPDRQRGRNFKCDATLNNTIQTSIIQSAQQHHMSGSGTVSCLALAVTLQSIFNGHIYVLRCVFLTSVAPLEGKLRVQHCHNKEKIPLHIVLCVCVCVRSSATLFVYKHLINI